LQSQQGAVPLAAAFGGEEPGDRHQHGNIRRGFGGLGGQATAKQREGNNRCRNVTPRTAGKTCIHDAFPALAKGPESMIALHRLLTSLNMM
jgi:hypothetical protein